MREWHGLDCVSCTHRQRLRSWKGRRVRNGDSTAGKSLICVRSHLWCFESVLRRLYSTWSWELRWVLPSDENSLPCKADSHSKHALISIVWPLELKLESLSKALLGLAYLAGNSRTTMIPSSLNFRGVILQTQMVESLDFALPFPTKPPRTAES